MFWKVRGKHKFFYTENEEERAELLADYPDSIPSKDGGFFWMMGITERYVLISSSLHSYGEVEFL